MHSSTSASSSSKIEESPPLSERFSFVARAARRQLYRENKTFFMFCPSDGDREIKINASWLRKGLVINAKSESGVLALSCIFRNDNSRRARRENATTGHAWWRDAVTKPRAGTDFCYCSMRYRCGGFSRKLFSVAVLSLLSTHYSVWSFHQLNSQNKSFQQMQKSSASRLVRLMMCDAEF